MKIPFYKKLIPRSIRLKWLKNDIINYLEGIKLNQEQTEVYDYLKKNPIHVFPYDFVQKYNADAIKVELDKTNNLLFTIWEGKKLYYKNGSRIQKAKEYFNGLILEQDPLSPHRYLAGSFDVNTDDILVDVGAAEGNFSLSAIEKVKHVYLFEVEKDWLAALEATFEPWKNKVTIVQKYVSDYDSENTITLDSYFGAHGKVNFIKADVEGAEGEVLKGATKLIQNQIKIQAAICTYHRQEDASNLDIQMNQMGFQTSFTNKFMIFYFNKTNVICPPFLRRAIIRGIKN